MKRQNKYITIIKKGFLFLKEWSNVVTAIAMVISIFYVMYSTNKNLKLVSEALNASNEQLLLQKKSIPAQFIMSYKNINTSQEQAFIRNSGKTHLNNVTTEWEYYFISEDDKVYLATNMINIIENDSLLLEELRKSNYIKYPSDFDGLFGTGRKFAISYLKPINSNLTYDESETLLDISSSSIQNAIKLNRILGTQMFMRWRIKYNEELSNKEMITYKYIWFCNNERNDCDKRKDLKEIIGGERIIELIKNYEKNTKGIIYK